MNKTRWMGFAAALGMAMLVIGARAEISTNLQKQTTYTTKNKVATQSFVDRDGNIVMADDLGYATLVNSYTVGTKLEKTEYFDAEGKPVNNKDGFSVRLLTYSMNNIKTEEFLDTEGNPAPGPSGYSRMETKWYEGKKHIETRYYGTDGKLFRDSKQFAIRRTEYSDDKKLKWVQPLSDSYYDADENLMRGPNGFARVEYEYVGGTGRASRTTYLDENGDLYYYKKAGYAVLERTNKQGHFVKDAYYGADGELCAGPKGYAYVEMKYGNESKPIAEAYFDAEGNPYKMPGGYYNLTRKYAAKGRIAEEAYYDEFGDPCLCKDGYHAKRSTYRKDGKVIKQFYVGTDGKWMIHPTLGYASLENDYDGKRLIRTTFLDTRKKAIDAAQGFAITEYLFNKRLPAGIRYLNSKGQPAMGPDGFSWAEYTSDQDGNILTEIYYDTEGNPTANTDGIFEVKNTWENGKKTEIACFREGEPALDAKGVHLTRYEYNGDGKETKSAFFGTKNQPVMSEDGYAAKTTEYQTNGKPASVRYYDENGKLILTPGKVYAYQQTEYNEEGTEYTLSNYDTDQQLMTVDGYAAQVCTVDEEGRVLRTIYLDEQENRIANKNGYGAIENTYNEEGLVVSVTYRDLQDELMNCVDEYAFLQREYDQYGNVNEERYYGTNGEPVIQKMGYSCLRRVYAMKGRMLEERYYGLNGEPVLSESSGAAVITREYEQRSGGNHAGI